MRPPVGIRAECLARLGRSNRFGVILNNQGGSYAPGMFAAMTS
ncbi:hypothetical protein ACIBU0_34270 [Streptomyces sp. NPDC049627]